MKDKSSTDKKMSPSVAAKVQRAVLRGVRLLDKRDPFWWNGVDAPLVIEGMVGHIDLDRLNLAVPTFCVLGQRHVDKYSGAVATLRLSPAAQSRNGFEAPERIRCDNARRNAWFSALTELWATVIQSRRYPRRAVARTPFAIEANATWAKP